MRYTNISTDFLYNWTKSIAASWIWSFCNSCFGSVLHWGWWKVRITRYVCHPNRPVSCWLLTPAQMLKLYLGSKVLFWLIGRDLLNIISSMVHSSTPFKYAKVEDQNYKRTSTKEFTNFVCSNDEFNGNLRVEPGSKTLTIHRMNNSTTRT